MADDLSLLLKIKGDAASGKAAIAETRAAIATLRSTFGTEFGAMQNASNKAFSSITDNLNVFVGQRIPLVGGAFVRVSENLRGFGTEASKVEQGTAKLASTIEGLAKETGKSSGEITSFLTKFVQLETQAKRDTAAIEAFGAAAAQKLIPQLEQAGEELSTVATESAATGASLASLAGPIGIAVVVIGALVAGTALLAKGLFNLAEQAADFRGKMFDLSQQTGVSVETLSALEIVAKTTGGSIESIAQSLVIFQGKLDEAQDSSSKAGKQFEELGISTNNTETAFRDALTQLAKMPEGFHQTNTAAELFGRRGGKQVLAILKELHGDLDGAIKQFREMGIIISTEDAVAADKFNDQLAILGFQTRALLGKEVIPAALKAAEDFSKLLKDNKVAIDGVARSLGLFASVIGSQFSKDLSTVNSVLESYAQLWERIAKATQTVSTLLPGRVLGGIIAPIGVPGIATAGAAGKEGISSAEALKRAEEAAKGAVKAIDDAEKAAQVRLKSALARAGDAAAVELETERKLREDLRLEFEKRNSELETHYKQEQTLIDLHLASLNKQIAAERVAVQEGFNNRAIDQEEFLNRTRDLDLRAEQAKNKAAEESRRLESEKGLALTKQELALREQLSAIAETRRKGEMDRLKAAREREAITESDLITKQLEFLKKAHEERLGIITFEINALSTSTEEKKKLDTEKKQSEQEYTDAVKRLTRERIDALNEEAAARGPGASVKGQSPDQIAQQAGAIANAVAGIPPVLAGTASAIEQLFGAINEHLSGDKQTAATAGLQTMVEVFGQLGQAVGEVVQAFVLYGNAGTSVRKVTAQILAGIAQQAAIKAIFELAEGFAALAMAFFGIPNAGPSATAHFTAAAIYGGIAGIAAVAGRGIAGNSFNQTNASPSSGASGGSTSKGTPATREVDRTGGTSQPHITVHVTVVGQATEGFKYMVEKAVADSVRDNGVMRRIQNGDFV